MAGSNFVGPILTAQQSMRIAGDNLSNVNVNGAKGPAQDFANLVAGTGNVDVKSRSTIAQKGNVQFTNREGDFSVKNQNNGMYCFLPVAANADSTEVLLTPTGSFETDKNGILKEDSSGKVLLGAKLTGGEITSDFSELVPIFIDKNAILQAEATTKIDTTMRLNSGEIVTGKAQTLLTTQGSPDKFINPGALKSGTSFSVTAIDGAKNEYSKRSDGARKPFLQQYTFGGFVHSGKFDGAQNNLIAQDNKTIQIKAGNNNVTITASTTAKNNKEFLDHLVAQINTNSALEAIVLTDTVGGTNQLSIMIAPKNLSSDLEVADDPTAPNQLFQTLAFDNSSIPSAENGENRFVTMQGLAGLLKSNSKAFSKVEQMTTNGASSSVLLLETASSSSVMITNRSQDPDKNLLGILGMSDKQIGTQQPSYSPLASGKGSMSKGDVTPDTLSESKVYDAQGNARQVYMTAKKLGDNIWAAEIYYPQDNIKGNNLIAQAGILRFDGSGHLQGISKIETPYVSKDIGDLSQELNLSVGAANGDTLDITAGGITRSFQYDPGAGIKSTFDLITAILSSDLPIKVNISKDGNASKLEFTGAAPDIAVSISGALADPNKMNIVQESQAAIPALGSSNAVFDWTSVPDGVSPSSIDISFSTENILQQNMDYTLNLGVKDGRTTATFSSWSSDENGIISAVFSNGETQNLYQVPVAAVIAPQHLMERDSGMYSQSINSGHVQYFAAGSGSAPNILPRSVEGSNVASIKEMTQIIDTGQWNAMLTAGFQVNNSMINDIISAAKR